VKTELTHPLQNADFQSIFASSASALTASKKFNYHEWEINYALSNDPKGIVYVDPNPLPHRVAQKRKMSKT